MALTDIDGQRLGDSVADKLGNRNLIINGAMTIDQRNAGASASFGSYGYVLDRWNQAKNTGSAGTVQQSSEAPAGFKNSVLITNNATGASPSSGDQNRFQTRIEGYNAAHLEFGTANAKTITLSFWVRSSLTGTYGIGFSNSAFDRSHVKTYSISSADTWEQKTITLTGDTTGTWLNDTGTGLAVTFDLGSGTDAEGTENAWQANTKYRTSSCVNWIGTGSATFYITGVQLEVGSTATPFEHRSYGDELRRCQRYYYMIGNSLNSSVCSGAIYATNNFYGAIDLPVAMRTSPSIDVSNATGHFAVYSDSSGDNCNTCILTVTRPNIVEINIGSSQGLSGATQGHGAWLRVNSNDAHLAVTAEL